LRIALAQGALFDDALTALAAIGCDVSGVTRDARRLLVRADDFEIVRARPSDIATYVERGAAELGIVGKDVLEETGARVLELVDLVATGATLAANDLVIVEEISISTARLIANSSAYHTRRDEIAPIVERLAMWASERIGAGAPA